MLFPNHADHLAKFRIPAEILEAASVRSVSNDEAREMLGLSGHQGADLGGILFPYTSPRTGARAGGRIRLDKLLPNDGGKYVSEPGCRHLFFAPCAEEWLTDISVPIVIVESEKAALALSALTSRAGRKLLLIAIGGCWGWRRRIGNRRLPEGGAEAETGPSPDFDLVSWGGREVIICFDSNASTNVEVQKARGALAQELSTRTARVRLAQVPGYKNVNGPDDLIALFGDAEMLKVLDSPYSATITLWPGARPAAVDEAEKALLAHSEHLQIFQRSAELVRVISLPESCNGGGLMRPEGSVQLEPLSRMALTEILDRIVRWQRTDSDGNVRTVDCPDKVAGFYLARTGAWRVPSLTGIISAPILRHDGTILSRPGHDAQTGLFLVTNQDWPQIPEQPGNQDAKNALQSLREPFSEFPFLSEWDSSVHVTAILTAIQRRLLGPSPIFGYSAPAQRSGKSLLAESVAILATGKPAPATSVSGDREEMRKAITSILREGHSIINLDNVEGALSSPELAKAITQSEYGDRLLGESRMLRLPTNVFWTATGNNLEFRKDLSSRALLCRIDSGVERPEERTFKIQNFKEFITQNRTRLIVAGLTILRAYFVAGRPKQDVKAWGGFEDWSASIREPLIWAGLQDPCKTREAVLANDPEREESHAILHSLREAFGGRQFTVKEIINVCKTNDALKSVLLAGACRRDAMDQLDPKRMGWLCRHLRDRVVGGLRLHRADDSSTKIARWQVDVSNDSPRGQGGHGGHIPLIATNSAAKSDAGRPETDPMTPMIPDDEVSV